MGNDKFVTMHFGRLELAPLQEEKRPASKATAVFTPDTRLKERRKGVERREQPRLTEGRRTVEDRRAKKGWDRAKP